MAKPTDDWTSLSGDQRHAFTLRLVAVYGNTCHECGLPISADDLTCGHIIARSQGGKTTLDNCRPEHASCNYSKGARIAGQRVIEEDNLALFWQQ